MTTVLSTTTVTTVVATVTVVPRLEVSFPYAYSKQTAHIWKTASTAQSATLTTLSHQAQAVAQATVSVTRASSSPQA
jgi:hypothetical protein